MLTVATGAPTPAAVAAGAGAVAITTTAGMYANQSQTPIQVAAGGTTTTVTTGHVFRYGDLVTFPIDDLTPPNTLLAIVVEVHPVNGDYDHNKVTVSTASLQRVIVSIRDLALIQPVPISALD
jgi:hypothetical protein